MSRRLSEEDGDLPGNDRVSEGGDNQPKRKRKKWDEDQAPPESSTHTSADEAFNSGPPTQPKAAGAPAPSFKDTQAQMRAMMMDPNASAQANQDA